MHPHPPASPRGALDAVVFLSAALFTAIPESILIWFSSLRESNAFWTNAGGYSLGMRDTVLLYYYPLAALVFLLLLKLKLAALLGCWGLFFSSLAISTADNIINLLEGRSLFNHHQPRISFSN
jgi:hypothetical protein